MLTKLLSTSIIAGAFLIGCGGDVREQGGAQDAKTPHQVDMTTKSIRDDIDNPNNQDYVNYMRTYYLNSTQFIVSQPGGFNGYYPPTIRLRTSKNPDLKYVFYIDTDHDTNTGYVNPWLAKAGADFLIEDNIKYKYTGTPGSNEWSWEVVDWDAGDVQKGESIVIDSRGDLVYGATFNQDWSYNGFMGYYNLYPNAKNEYLNDVNSGSLKFKVYDIDGDLHFQSLDSQNILSNAEFVNYEFTVAGQNYYTEGNILFHEDGTTVSGPGQIEHVIRNHNAVTIIPKGFFPAEDFDVENRDEFEVESATIRDADWNVLFHNAAH